MRISHALYMIMVFAVAMALWRDEVGRVGVIVFSIGLGMTVTCVTSLMLLFRTVGAFGEAKTFVSHVEAAFATGILIVITASIEGILFLLGWVLIDVFVRQT